MLPSLSLLLGACQTGPTETGPTDTGESDITLIPLSDTALLRRLSLDLRGVTPSLTELEALESGTTLETLRADYLADPRLEDAMTERFAERWLTRTDVFNLTTASYDLDDALEFSLERSIGEEAPRLAAHVIASDLPWSTLVTADYTRANDLLLELWPLVALEDGEGWRTARYTDARPPIGVLATNGLWLRYDTSNANLNRHRAAALSRLLLCSDYLTRPVTFSSAGLIDSSALEDAVHSEPACVSCHATLDPLASLLFGFWWFDRYDTTELTYYHAEREQLGELYLDAKPGWFGQPIPDVDHLGDVIAADPRFSECAVRTMAELLWQRPVTLADFETLRALQDDFSARDQSSGALLIAILDSAEYQAGDVTGAAGVADTIATRRLLSSSQLTTAVADLTGFTWEWEGFSQLENDDIGYRILVGGVDGSTVTSRLTVPTIASLLVIKRLSQAAADAVVQHDLVESRSPRLLSAVDLQTVPDDDAFDAQLTALYRQLYATTPDDAERAADAELWSAVAAEDGAAAAWRSLLATLLRDPAFWTY